jgi:hypothetical protein
MDVCGERKTVFERAARRQVERGPRSRPAGARRRGRGGPRAGGKPRGRVASLLARILLVRSTRRQRSAPGSSSRDLHTRPSGRRRPPPQRAGRTSGGSHASPRSRRAPVPRIALPLPAPGPAVGAPHRPSTRRGARSRPSNGSSPRPGEARRALDRSSRRSAIGGLRAPNCSPRRARRRSGRWSAVRTRGGAPCASERPPGRGAAGLSRRSAPPGGRRGGRSGGWSAARRGAGGGCGRASRGQRPRLQPWLVTSASYVARTRSVTAR